MRKLLSGFLLSVVLLLMQQGSVLHAIGHLSEALRAPTDIQHEHPGSVDPCGGCVAFAQLAAGAVFNALLPPPVCDLGPIGLTLSGVLIDALPPLRPRSRGPPAPL